MNPFMTGDAERHQILRIMRATIDERLDVMHERRENISASLLATLTERMSRQVSISNPAPYATIPLVLIVATREVVVVPLHHFLVLLAVAALPVREVRAARHAAGALRFTGHCVSPSIKPSRSIASPRRLIPYPILAESIISLSTL